MCCRVCKPFLANGKPLSNSHSNCSEHHMLCTVHIGFCEHESCRCMQHALHQNDFFFVFSIHRRPCPIDRAALQPKRAPFSKCCLMLSFFHAGPKVPSELLAESPPNNVVPEGLAVSLYSLFISSNSIMKATVGSLWQKVWR